MKRRTVRLLVALAALMAVMMMVSAVPAFASASPDNDGKASKAPGEGKAAVICSTDTVPFFLCEPFS